MNHFTSEPDAFFFFQDWFHFFFEPGFEKREPIGVPKKGTDLDSTKEKKMCLENESQKLEPTLVLKFGTHASASVRFFLKPLFVFF